MFSWVDHSKDKIWKKIYGTQKLQKTIENFYLELSEHRKMFAMGHGEELMTITLILFIHVIFLSKKVFKKRIFEQKGGQLSKIRN